MVGAAVGLGSRVGDGVAPSTQFRTGGTGVDLRVGLGASVDVGGMGIGTGAGGGGWLLKSSRKTPSPSVAA